MKSLLSRVVFAAVNGEVAFFKKNKNKANKPDHGQIKQKSDGDASGDGASSFNTKQRYLIVFTLPLIY